MPAVGVLLELRALDVGELAAGLRLAAHGGEQPAVGDDARQQRARLLGRREPRQDPERVRVHLQELRGDGVDAREMVQQLVVRPVAPVPPQVLAAELARRGQREQPGGAQLPEVLLREGAVVVERTGARAEAVGQRVDPAQSLRLLRGGHGVDRSELLRIGEVVVLELGIGAEERVLGHVGAEAAGRRASGPRASAMAAGVVRRRRRSRRRGSGRRARRRRARTRRSRSGCR